MNQVLIAIISFSIMIPAVIGLIRFHEIGHAYYPFLLLVWLAFFNEVLSFLLIRKHHPNAVNSNIYYLLEGLLLVVQFKKWQLFTASSRAYPLLIGLFLLTWCVENFIVGSVALFPSYFIILHSYLLSLVSISMINKLLVQEKRNLLKNSIFILCVGFILYFTSAVLVEAFYLYGVSASKSFQTAIVRIMSFVNLFTNLLYTLAFLWMPKKQRFSFSY